MQTVLNLHRVYDKRGQREYFQIEVDGITVRAASNTFRWSIGRSVEDALLWAHRHDIHVTPGRQAPRWPHLHKTRPSCGLERKARLKWFGAL